MAEQKRFTIGKGPFIRKADWNNYGTATMMRDFVIALLPLILFAWYKNGIAPFLNYDAGFIQMLYPLIFVIIGGLTSFLLEGLYFLIFMKENDVFTKLKYSYAIIPGLLLAMILPLNTPIWVLIFGCVFANIISKMLFGGFGYNLFNPALIGYVFIITAFYGVIGSALNPTEQTIITSGATPLTDFFSTLDKQAFNFEGIKLTSFLNSYGGLSNFFIGTIPGSIAETSSLLCLVSFAYLLIRRTINWRIPVIYIATVFVFTYLIGALNGFADDIRFPLFNILSGGLFFGAVFMATEPVTSPRTPNGKVIYALLLGVFTVVFRYLSDLPEGVATSILFLNILTPIIDSVFAKVRVNEKSNKRVMSYVYVSIILIAIVSYTLFAVGA